MDIPYTRNERSGNNSAEKQLITDVAPGHCRETPGRLSEPVPHGLTLSFRERQSQRPHAPVWAWPRIRGMHRTMKNAAIACHLINVPARPPILACTLAQEALTACAHHAITDVGDFTGERSDPDVKTAFVPTPVITSTSALIRMVS